MERAAHRAVLAALDVDAPRVVIEGKEYARVERCRSCLRLQKLARWRTISQSAGWRVAMSTDVQIFLDLPHETREFLHDNRVDLIEELRAREDLDVRHGAGDDPTEPLGAKSVTLVIVAAAVAAPLVAAGIARVLDAIARGKHRVQERRLKAVCDEHGNPVRDPSGRPVFYWEEINRSLPPPTDPRSETLGLTVQPWKISVTMDSKP